MEIRLIRHFATEGNLEKRYIGVTDEEIKDLTLAMAYSGEVLDLSTLGENVVDKHSTGGVGDKITLILMPIVASLGVPVAKMSGRGLRIYRRNNR